MFIRTPDPVAAKEAEINELTARLRLTEAQLSHAQAALEMAAVEAPQEDDCVECEDLCALQQEVADASCDLMEVNSVYKNELHDCNAKMPRKFVCNGMSEVLCSIRELMQALICTREHHLAIAAYNHAYCAGRYAPDHVEEKRCQLMQFIEDNPDIDPRCLAYINKILVLASA